MDKKQKELLLDFLRKAGAGVLPDENDLCKEYFFDEIAMIMEYAQAYYDGKRGFTL